MTDVSRASDKIPQTQVENGRPVTIPGKKKDGKAAENLTRTKNPSQTSLAIEYFEGGKGGHADSRRPSVRVKPTPSSKGESLSTNEHIQITEHKDTHKPSYTRRINLSSKGKSVEAKDNYKSASTYPIATEQSNVSG
jgi:hypothetical protein